MSVLLITSPLYVSLRLAKRGALSLPLVSFAMATLSCSTAQAGDEKLDEVVVTALAIKSSVDDAIQPVDVVSEAELQQQLSSSIGETLAKQPGVTASYFGPTASRPIIRGLSGERVQMLEDSLSALDVSSLSEDHAVSIEDSLAKQIEIVKGPAALLYGSGAVGGVVNVLDNRIPEQVFTKPVSGSVEARVDSATHETAGVGQLNLGSDHLALHLDGYKKQSDDVSIPGSAFSARAKTELLADDPNAFIPQGRIYNSASDSKGGAAGLSWLGDAGFVGVAVSGFDTYYGVPIAPGDTPADGSHIDMQQTRVDMKARWDVNGDVLQSLQLRAAHNNYEHAELEADGSTGTQFNQQGTEIRLTADHQLGELHGSAGVQYRYLDFVASGDERFVPPSVTRNLGAFAFEQYMMEPITLEAGLRIEQQHIAPTADSGYATYSKASTSASLGGLWKLSDEQSLAINVTHSQRHPSATELYADGVHDATGQYIVGDTTLRPETANTVDVVWRGGDTLHWHISAYLDQFQDYIYLSPTGEEEDGLPKYVYRQADARYVGAEAALQWHVFEQDTRHLDIQLTSDAVRATLQDGSPVPQIPPFRVGVEFDYTFNDWQSTLSTFRYAKQDRVADNETPTDGYSMVDASLSRDWLLSDALTLKTFLKGSNLTNADARRATSPLKDYAPLPGRSATLGLTLQF